MSTHNRQDVTLRHLLMVEAECWLADVFTSPENFDGEGKDAYEVLLDRFAQEIYGDVLPRFRRGLNEIVEKQSARECTCPKGRVDAACPHHGRDES